MERYILIWENWGGEYGNPVQWKLPGVYEGGPHENSQ